MSTPETHQALYRKYRPENFDHVVGQDPIVNVLKEAIKTKKVSHAYLFCGGRGTGKTTVARIFAKDLHCSPEDTIEIDAASNRGIDEIRELREAVRSMPFSSAYKVYIVDEAHMLTKEASNALLKTLEEPPAHVIFILATTDPEKLPQTIVSRCQTMAFKQPPIEVLASQLRFVAEKEGRILEEEASRLLAALGKGSYRDALGILEQTLLHSKGKEILCADIATLYGSPKEELIVTLLESLYTKNTTLLLETLSLCKEQGTDPVSLYKETIECFRICLLSRIGEQSVSYHKLASIQEKLTHLAKTYPAEITSGKLLTLLEKETYLNLTHVDPYISLQLIFLNYIGQ